MFPHFLNKVIKWLVLYLPLTIGAPKYVDEKESLQISDTDSIMEKNGKTIAFGLINFLTRAHFIISYNMTNSFTDSPIAITKNKGHQQTGCKKP